MPTRRSSGGTCASGAETTVADQDAPPSSLSKPAIWRSSVVLPQPDGPRTADELAVRDVERNVVRARGSAPNAC